MLNKEVEHKTLGIGTAIESRNGGFEIRVVFQSGKSRWVRQQELTIVDDGEIVEIDFTVGDFAKHDQFGIGEVVEIIPDELGYKVTILFGTDRKTLQQRYAKLKKYTGPRKEVIEVPITPFMPPPEESKNFHSRRVVEAFRLGIVPSDDVESFTVGRDMEINTIKKWLIDPSERSLLVVGEYGCGKTHMLQYLSMRALHDGFAVATISMDTRENPFHKPKRVYSKLVTNLFYPCRSTSKLQDFRHLLRSARSAGAFGEHLYFSQVNDFDDNTLLQWIEGRESMARPVVQTFDHGYAFNQYKDLRPMYDDTVSANLYCYLLSGLGWACKVRLGLRGLVLIFDESEAIDRASYQYQNERSMNFVKGLLETAQDNPLLLQHPQKTGLVHSSRGEMAALPFLFKIPAGLKLVFAFSDETAYSKLADFEGSSKLVLDSLQVNMLRELQEKVSGYYADAYGWNGAERSAIAHRMMEDRFKEKPSGSRRLIKGCVESLDILRFGDLQTI